MEKTVGNETISSYRWVILSLLFFATLINYFDRIVLSILVPEIKSDLKITDIQYSYVLMAFQVAYTIGCFGAGKFIDWAGTKLGYLLSIFFWSLSAALHATVKTAYGLGVLRFFLGITESGNFPAAIKAVSEWFPKKERALATSLFNSGPNIAMIIGAPIIAFLTIKLNWRWAFLIIGLIGFLLVAIWPFVYRNNKKVIFEESESPSEKISWGKLLKIRATYGIMLGKFLTDPVWWFYIFWLPNYLNTQRGLDLKSIAVAIPCVYLLGIIIGNIGGWFPGYLINRGFSTGKARKITMLISALCMPISAFSAVTGDIWTAVILISLACGAHSSWSANIFTLVSDNFHSSSVGSVTGLAGFAGGVGGMLFSTIAVGYIVTYFGYLPIFIIMSLLHPIAIISIHFLIKVKEN